LYFGFVDKKKRKEEREREKQRKQWIMKGGKDKIQKFIDNRLFIPKTKTKQNKKTKR
jgi:hypothetical protein